MVAALACFHGCSSVVGLNWTGHMSFLTGQDRTPKFARQVLLYQTESGLIFLTFYLRGHTLITLAQKGA